MQPPQPPPQQFQSNSGTSWGNDKILDLLTSLTQRLQNQAKEMQNQTNKMGELKNQFREIAEFMGQMQEQSELSNLNSKGDFEIDEDITLGSGIEAGTSPKMSKPSQEEDEQLLREKEEEEQATQAWKKPCRNLPLLHHLCRSPPKDPTPPNSSKVVPNSIISNLSPPNAIFLADSCNPKNERLRKTSWKPFQRCKLISRVLN